MGNVLIINAHQYYPFAEGNFNQALISIAEKHLKAKGYTVKTVKPSEGYDVEEALENHNWADFVLLQSPVNWMGVPWSFKKYMDDVYTAGMGGAMCNGDGRSEDAPKKNYGRGGTLTGTKYMLSLTANAPAESFNDPTEFFEGKGVDDLMFPMHMNFKFFDMTPMPTFMAYDVMKNAEPEKDFERFEEHLDKNF
ncbi:NAD(P)H-dependent oxidoreductase [Idiomarina sp.]|uniref:NAD(P)H-dependent oxidoreductase n=1 Tax=Idiomarina sp. TaxID=1874361 RepID=UPI002ECAFB0A|nr:NAD(P)H-dependent oxidoreductase [Pseudomonadota bacterium]